MFKDKGFDLRISIAFWVASLSMNSLKIKQNSPRPSRAALIMSVSKELDILFELGQFVLVDVFGEFFDIKEF